MSISTNNLIVASCYKQGTELKIKSGFWEACFNGKCLSHKNIMYKYIEKTAIELQLDEWLKHAQGLLIVTSTYSMLAGIFCTLLFFNDRCEEYLVAAALFITTLTYGSCLFLVDEGTNKSNSSILKAMCETDTADWKLSWSFKISVVGFVFSGCGFIFAALLQCHLRKRTAPTTQFYSRMDQEYL